MSEFKAYERDEAALVKAFRSEFEDEGRNGDYDNLTPMQTALRTMRTQRRRIEALERALVESGYIREEVEALLEEQPVSDLAENTAIIQKIRDRLATAFDRGEGSAFAHVAQLLDPGTDSSGIEFVEMKIKELKRQVNPAPTLLSPPMISAETVTTILRDILDGTIPVPGLKVSKTLKKRMKQSKAEAKKLAEARKVK